MYPQTNHTIVYHDYLCFFGWLKLILWKAFGFDSKKNEAKQKETNFTKGKGKGNAGKKYNLRKQLDIIVYPQTNHTIVYQGYSWTTLLKNCLSHVFNWVLIRHHIFWEIRHF